MLDHDIIETIRALDGVSPACTARPGSASGRRGHWREPVDALAVRRDGAAAGRTDARDAASPRAG
jgi:hypothetical protein